MPAETIAQKLLFLKLQVVRNLMRIFGLRLCMIRIKNAGQSFFDAIA